MGSRDGQEVRARSTVLAAWAMAQEASGTHYTSLSPISLWIPSGQTGHSTRSTQGRTLLPSITEVRPCSGA